MDTATTVDGTERGPLMLNPKLMLGTDATTEVTMADPTGKFLFHQNYLVTFKF